MLDNLKKYKIPVECEIKAEMFHTFVIYGDLIPEAAQSFEKILDFIKRQFEK